MKFNDFNQERIIIIDNGTGQIKNGFNNIIDFERGVNSTSTMIGHPRYKSLMSSMGKFKPYYIGTEVYEKITKGLLDVQHPITNGIISNWDDIEKIWEINLLNLSSTSTSTSSHPVLLTETFNNPRKCREKMAEIMFEKFDIPSLYIANQSLLSYYSSSTSSSFDNALVVDIGHGLTQLVPISNGQPIKDASIGLNYLSGDEISKNIRNDTLKDFNIDNFNVLDKIKEKFIVSIDNYNDDDDDDDHHHHHHSESITNDNKCTIKKTTTTTTSTSSNTPDETNSCNNSTTTTSPFTLPDGNIIEIDINSIKKNVENTLFKPSTNSSINNAIGLHQAIHGLVLKYKLFNDNNNHNCGENENIDDLYRNIIITGGTSMINGFNNRLYSELKNSLPQNNENENDNDCGSSGSSGCGGNNDINININSPTDHNRKYSVFKGGCMFSSLSNFNSMCVSRSEYNELFK